MREDESLLTAEQSVWSMYVFPLPLNANEALTHPRPLACLPLDCYFLSTTIIKKRDSRLRFFDTINLFILSFAWFAYYNSEKWQTHAHARAPRCRLASKSERPDEFGDDYGDRHRHDGSYENGKGAPSRQTRRLKIPAQERAASTSLNALNASTASPELGGSGAGGKLRSGHGSERGGR